MYRVRKQFKAEIAHILESAHSKCCTDCIHGHSYVFEVVLKSKTLNADDMVTDFGLVKSWVVPMIEEWDHALVVSSLHSNLIDLYRSYRKVREIRGNPTAENMARVLFEMIKDSMIRANSDVQVESVRVHETSTGWAEYSEE